MVRIAVLPPSPLCSPRNPLVSIIDTSAITNLEPETLFIVALPASLSKLGSAQWNEEHGVNPNDKGQRTEPQLLKDLLTHPDSAVLAHKICLLRMFSTLQEKDPQWYDIKIPRQ